MQSKSCIIRPAEFEDVDALFALTRIKGVKEALPGVMKTWFEHDISQRLAGSRRHQLLVAELDNKIVGYIRFLHRLRPEKDGIWQTTGHETAVHPEYRKRGIATQLVEARLTNTLEHRHGQQGRLFIKAPADIPANRFHQAQGFVVTGTETLPTGRSLHLYTLDLTRYRPLHQTVNEEKGVGRCP